MSRDPSLFLSLMMAVGPRGRATRIVIGGAITVLLCRTMVTFGADEAVLKPRVPLDQIEAARTWTNPVAATPENIEKGKALFHGKAFCVTCHGRDGKGLGDIEGLVGKLPRNFT
ncbi:MAG TPA: hypothetical protein VH681_11845, partial [Nitrospiraceae bacterium]